MATGDILIEITVEGGTKKSATIPSATRVNALAWMNRERGGDDGEPNLTDATYSVHIANNTAKSIIHAAEKSLTLAAKPDTPTFTAAT
tara:strand:+ start:135 stop:398 length:264 start_codon:yes stop_codon:yes gene_type:complete